MKLIRKILNNIKNINSTKLTLSKVKTKNIIITETNGIKFFINFGIFSII